VLGRDKPDVPINDVANISISVSGAGPTRAGFGEPLIAACSTPFSSGIREYSTLTGMVADGFAATDPAYLCAAQLTAQRPSVTAWKIGRRPTSTFTQIIHLTCLSTSNTDKYNFSIRTPGGTWHVLSIASSGTVATDTATINTALTALALTSLTVTHDATNVILTMAAGKLVDVQSDIVHMTLQDVTTFSGATLTNDLNAILAADGAWYGLLLDSNSPAEITQAAAWAESNGKLFGYNTSDTACGDPASTGDVMFLEKGLTHARSFGLFTQTLLSYSASAWMGKLFPTDAGSENWAFKTLANVPFDTLSDTQIHAIENKNGSVYTVLLGVPITQFGKTPSGEWIDVTRGIDAFTNDLQVGIVAMQLNNKKVPFTDLGGDMVRSVIQTSITKFIDRGFIAQTPAPTIFVPRVADISPTDRAARNFTGSQFAAQVAGAINDVSVQGVLNQ
jgi:hypothetical protein